jgi:hypothetical protein
LHAVTVILLCVRCIRLEWPPTGAGLGFLTPWQTLFVAGQEGSRPGRSLLFFIFLRNTPVLSQYSFPLIPFFSCLNRRQRETYIRTSCSLQQTSSDDDNESMSNLVALSKRKRDGSLSRTAVNYPTNNLMEYLRSEHQIDDQTVNFLRRHAINGKRLLLFGSSSEEFLVQTLHDVS